MTPAELREWRTEAGLTQSGLAALLGVHWLTISYWERGTRVFPAYLELALRALTCSICGEQSLK